MNRSKNIDTLRQQKIAEIRSAGKTTIWIPELDHIKDLITGIDLYVTQEGGIRKETPPGIYLWDGGWRKVNHVEGLSKVRAVNYWCSYYVSLDPCMQKAIESGCCNGELSSIKLIPWADDLGLLQGFDKVHIAQPWITILDYNRSKQWLDVRREALWNDWLEKELDKRTKG
ncbi:MAG: hypothetical protein PVI97_00320 [Candidatus Thiodiazotropha sp.]|jgi:hypothetical protein